jgi:hypothetical protein
MRVSMIVIASVSNNIGGVAVFLASLLRCIVWPLREVLTEAKTYG